MLECRRSLLALSLISFGIDVFGLWSAPRHDFYGLKDRDRRRR